MWLSSDSSSFVNCRALPPTRVRVSPSAPFRSRSSNYQSATLRTSRLQVRVLPGVPLSFTIEDLRFQTACGLPRTAERPVSETVSLGGAIPLTPTIFFNRQSSIGNPNAHVAQCRGSALKTRAVSVQIRPWASAARVAQRRGTKLKPSRVQVQVPPRAPFRNVNRPSEPGLGANECVPSGKWCESTAFRHCLVES